MADGRLRCCTPQGTVDVVYLIKYCLDGFEHLNKMFLCFEEVPRWFIDRFRRVGEQFCGVFAALCRGRVLQPGLFMELFASEATTRLQHALCAQLLVIGDLLTRSECLTHRSRSLVCLRSITNGRKIGLFMPQVQEVALPQGLVGMQALRSVVLKMYSQWKTCGISQEFVRPVERCLRKDAVADSRDLFEVLQEVELTVLGVAMVMGSIMGPGFLQYSQRAYRLECGEGRQDRDEEALT